MEPIVLKNSVFQSDVLKSENFRHVQWPGITFGAANFKELHSTCRCGRENLPEFLGQEFFNTIEPIAAFNSPYYRLLSTSFLCSFSNLLKVRINNHVCPCKRSGCWSFYLPWTSPILWTVKCFHTVPTQTELSSRDLSEYDCQFRLDPFRPWNNLDNRVLIWFTMYTGARLKPNIYAVFGALCSTTNTLSSSLIIHWS